MSETLWKSPDEPPEHENKILVSLEKIGLSGPGIRKSDRVPAAYYNIKWSKWYTLEFNVELDPKNIFGWAEWPEPAAERVEKVASE